MLRLEHHTHTALAKLIEDAIVAQHKILAFALIDCLGLVGGDPFQLYQFASQLFSILRAAMLGHAFDKLPQLVRSQKLRVNDKTDESIYWHRHRASPQRLSNVPPTRSIIAITAYVHIISKWALVMTSRFQKPATLDRDTECNLIGICAFLRSVKCFTKRSYDDDVFQAI